MMAFILGVLLNKHLMFLLWCTKLESKDQLLTEPLIQTKLSFFPKSKCMLLLLREKDLVLPNKRQINSRGGQNIQSQ